MSTATLAAGPAPKPSESIDAEPTIFDRLCRLSVEQYQKMAEVGILGPKDRVELLEGLLVTKMGRNPPRILAGKKFLRALLAAAPQGWHVAKEDPVTAITSVPEPDGSILRGEIEDYSDHIPVPGEVGLVVEIEDSTIRLDLTLMKRIYAAAMIPFYWVINIPSRRLEVFSGPTGEGETATYRNHEILQPADAVPLVIDGREVARIAVRDLLP